MSNPNFNKEMVFIFFVVLTYLLLGFCIYILINLGN